MKLSIAVVWSIERNHPKNLEFPDKYPIKSLFCEKTAAKEEEKYQQNSEAFLAKPMFFCGTHVK